MIRTSLRLEVIIRVLLLETLFARFRRRALSK